ncbi:MAG TPA: hypothetical protein VD884_11155, partial [Ohtaekwangia sp.]|nr:hypothetical protein [Ohtaekwangia sp.]
MKKFVLFFALLWMCDTLAAQEYEMHIKVRLKYNNNHVTGNSYFKIDFITDSAPLNWEWRKRVGPDRGEWGEYEKTFRVDQKHLVKELKIHTKREYDGGNDGNEGDASIIIPARLFPCSDTTIEKKLVAFESNSSVQITIRPLSLTTNGFAFLTEAHIVGNDDLTYFRYTVNAIFSDGSTLELEPGSQRNIESRTDFWGQALVLSPYTTRKRIKEIEVISRIELPWIGTKSETKTIKVDDKLEDDLVLDLGNAFHFLDATSQLKIRYYRPQTPIVSVPDGNTFLPSDNKISLNVSEINNEVFDWKYRINTFGTFQDLPAQFGTDQIISLSGKDLFGANWESQLFKPVQFKAIYTCPNETRESEIITLTHLPSAPGIVSADSIIETCAGSNDGKIRIKFDRPLYNNELFYVFLNGVQFEALPQTMDGDNILTIENLIADTYDVSLLSTFGSKGNGYSDGTNHKASVVLQPRPAIANFAVTTHDVHCYNGEDGAIDVTAQGGTNLFTATLWQGGSSLKTISFVDPSTGSFAELAAGTYSVTLKDSNGCDPKNGSNNVITLNPEVAQPAKGVVLSTVESVEPLGYGL